jgi:hypothetical protein
MIASPPVGGGFFFSSLDIEILAKLKPQKNSKNSQIYTLKKNRKKKSQFLCLKMAKFRQKKKHCTVSQLLDKFVKFFKIKNKLKIFLKIIKFKLIN